MSNKTHRYNENFLSVQQINKNDSSRKHQIKKQVFGEIKNVIHNQGLATPLKQDNLGNKHISSKYVSCANVIKRQQPMKTESKTQRPKSVYDDIEEINLLNYFDFRGECCSKPYKSDQQIWSEMNLYNDSFIDKILDVNEIEEVEESIYECINIKENQEDQEFINDIKDESNYNYWPLTEDSQEKSDINFLLEKPLPIDFDF